MGSLAPGKGLHIDIVLNEDNGDAESMQYLRDAIGEAQHAITSSDGEEILDFLDKFYGWTREADAFGKKAYKPFPIESGGEIRVTVVLKKDGAVKLDIRTWYVPA